MMNFRIAGLALLLSTIAGAGDATVPLEFKLTSHRPFYAVDRGGKTPEEYAAALKKGDAPNAPYGPAIALMVEVHNSSDKDIQAWGAPRPRFILKGPRAESVCEVAPTQFQCPPCRHYVIGAGKSVYLNVISFFNPDKDEPNVKDTVKRLSYSDGPSLQCVNWTEPGEYTLSATLDLGLSPPPPNPKPFDKSKYFFTKVPADIGVVTLESNPVKLTIRDGNETEYWSEALEDPDPEARFVAAHTLTAAIPLAEATRIKMAARLQDADARVRKAAARALQRPAKFPVNDPALFTHDPAVVALTSALKDTVPGVRGFAVSALSTWGPAIPTSAPAMLPLLQDADVAVRLATAEALGEMFSTVAPQDNSVAEALVGALKDSDERVVTAAIVDLGRIKAPATVAALIPLCSGAKAAIKCAAIEALGNFGSAAQPAEATLLEALNSNDTRASAARALGILKSDSKTLLPALTVALKAEQDEFGRVAIVRSMGACGALAAPALLEALKNDPEPAVKEFAANALGALGPDAKIAIPELTKLSTDKNADVRASAQKALNSIGGNPSDKK